MSCISFPRARQALPTVSSACFHAHLPHWRCEPFFDVPLHCPTKGLSMGRGWSVLPRELLEPSGTGFPWISSINRNWMEFAGPLDGDTKPPCMPAWYVIYGNLIIIHEALRSMPRGRFFLQTCLPTLFHLLKSLKQKRPDWHGWSQKNIRICSERPLLNQLFRKIVRSLHIFHF